MLNRIFLLILLFPSSFSWAALPTVSVKGFGSVGAGRSSVPSYYLSSFGTTGQKINFDRDTKVGLNFSSNFGSGWSVATQFLASYQDSSNYKLNLDWGLLSYEPIPEVALRAGRLVAGTWLFSQQINIGYNYLWVRPPAEVYGLLGGFYALNGASILAKAKIGTGILAAELYAGSNSGKVYSDNSNSNLSQTVTTIRISDAFGADLNYEPIEALTLHASYLQGKVSGYTESKLAIGTPIINAAVAGYTGTLITPLDVKVGRFYSFGEKFEHRNFILLAEFAKRMITGRAFNSSSAWYATLGYRVGTLTPYFTYSRLFGLEGTGNTHPETPTISTLQSGQTSYQIGLNAQVNASVVLKAEYQPTQFEYVDSSKKL